MTARRIAAVLAFLLGASLLWVGYLADQRRDDYYDCRQSAMDGLHNALGDRLEQSEDPERWVPMWRADFRAWHEQLALCTDPR